MRNNWLYYIVAALLNTILVTGTFITIKLQGMVVAIDPVMFAAAIFIMSVIAIVVVAALKAVITPITTKLPFINRRLIVS